MHDKVMDLDVLLEEINKYKQVPDCRHCDLYFRCKSNELMYTTENDNTIENGNHCRMLLEQICNYLEDGDELKRTIKGCIFGEGKWNCDTKCMFYNEEGRCVFPMLSKAYDKLNIWTIN